MYSKDQRTRFNLWTPSFPLLESRFFSSISSSPSLPLTLYRLFRLSYLVATTPLHLSLLVLSLPPLSFKFPSIFDPSWSSVTQKLVYPFLRRIIWALADVGDPNVLTRSTQEGDTPTWAWILEEFTVRFGGGERVVVKKEKGVTLPREVWERGWASELTGDEQVEFEPVNLFWFERVTEGRKGENEDWFRVRDDGKERIVMYLFGGGFVCGSPGEGGRCYKIARETGLRCVGVNYRRTVSRRGAFPAALQDALSCYFHLTLELGFKDVILAGDSAGAGLALNLLQYLTGSIYASLSSEEQAQSVLPSAALLISPWCDLTLESFPEDNRTDIILPSICSNSVKAYLEGFTSPSSSLNRNTQFNKYKDPARHPWFSPSLASSLPSLQLISKAYSSPSPPSSPSRPPLRILVTLGTSELFYPSLLSLVKNLKQVEEGGKVEVESVEGEGETHAFPLTPEWVSPGAVKAWERLRVWFEE
ncbi:hypothetical protein JCM3765_001692 [Sporobolomyces pararoseus]